MAKLSPAMTTALLRSTSSVTTALTRAYSSSLRSHRTERFTTCGAIRKATLASVLTKAGSGMRFNEHIEGDGPTVFAHACKFGLEGIVSKRKDSAYRSGRSPAWKNSDAPASGSE
jgi:hypothetical protein